MTCDENAEYKEGVCVCRENYTGDGIVCRKRDGKFPTVAFYCHLSNRVPLATNYPLVYFLYATLAQQTTGYSYFMDAGFVTASPSPEPTSETEGGLPDGAIAGIVIADVVSVVIVVVLSVGFIG